MKFTASLAVVVIIIVAIAGVGIGYAAGYSVAKTTTTTQTSTTTQYSTATKTTTVTTTPNLAGFWTAAYAFTWQYYMVQDATLVNLLNAGNSSLYLIDIRSTANYVAGHIPSAINVPFQNMTAAVNSNSLPMNKMIIVICHVGMTSSETMAILRALGYNAYYLAFGMAGWNNATGVGADGPHAAINYPIVTGTAPGTWTVFT